MKQTKSALKMAELFEKREDVIVEWMDEDYSGTFFAIVDDETNGSLATVIVDEFENEQGEKEFSVKYEISDGMGFAVIENRTPKSKKQMWRMVEEIIKNMKKYFNKITK